MLPGNNLPITLQEAKEVLADHRLGELHRNNIRKKKGFENFEVWFEKYMEKVHPDFIKNQYPLDKVFQKSIDLGYIKENEAQSLQAYCTLKNSFPAKEFTNLLAAHQYLVEVGSIAANEDCLSSQAINEAISKEKNLLINISTGE